MSLQRELPVERPASMDEQGHRVFLHPADVQGRYKRWRKVAHAILLVVFLVLPWIKINGHQALLLDVAHRRFSIFGLAFWAHDAPMLIFVFGAVFIGISLTTAVWGRLWCGWGCPETVFVEFVYRQIERWIEGNHIQRRRLAQAPWGLRKFALRALKWSAFLVVTLVITHSFLAYFIGTEALAEMMRHSPSEHPSAFGVMAFITAVLLFSFGWFREQFCIIMCPYGRFQSVLMDESSMVVGYDVERGEPRRGSDVPKAEQGDCINCYRCVDVCPTGIDIRRGVQMECVACTACIDACDAVMESVHKPHGLIRYTTYNELHHQPNHHFRVWVILLSLALLGVLSGLSYVLLTRPPVKATVFNAKGTPYQVIDESSQLYSNRYYMVASNYTFEDGEVQLKVANPQGVELVTQLNPLELKAGEEKNIGLFLKFPKTVLNNGSRRITIEMQTRALNGKWERTLTQEVGLVGPY